MSGLKITLPGYVSDTSLPLRKDDPILSEGSLLLVQPQHDVLPWVNRVPDQGYEVPNLASVMARNLIPEGKLEPSFNYQGTLGNAGLYERTSKGGFHTIITQSSDIGAGNGLSIGLSDDVMQYLIDHEGHDFYYSLWGNITRPSLTTDPGGSKTLMNIAKTSGSGWAAHQSHTISQLRPAGADRIGQYSTGRDALGPFLSVVAGKPDADFAGSTLADFPDENHRAIAQFGTVSLQNNFAAIRSALQSWVFYRMYIEDLTVSGRRFEEVRAIDEALYQQEVLTEGGKYFEDSFTNPSTIP